LRIDDAFICDIAPHKQGRRHDFEGGWGRGANVFKCGGVNTLKTVNIEKGGGYMTPVAPMVAPPLLINAKQTQRRWLCTSAER